MKSKTLNAIIALIFLVVMSFWAIAVPTGPGTVSKGSNDRRTLGIDNSTGGPIVQAQAGNVTALTINSSALTSRWQGYYGNVTGAITLDDASNNTLYNWQIASPQGEIYAANDSTVTWASVFCFNYTNNMTSQPRIQSFNGTDLELMIGAAISDKDSVNNTFTNTSFNGNFAVGGTTINGASGCMQATLYVDDTAQTSRFVEVLLTDNRSIIYTALLEQDQNGFQLGSATLDFEMIVGDDGDKPAAQNYFFFVELT